MKRQQRCCRWRWMSPSVSRDSNSSWHVFAPSDERVGNLTIVTRDADNLRRTLSQMEKIVRTTWSNPPSQGARIVAITLNTPELFTEWSARNIPTETTLILPREALAKTFPVVISLSSTLGRTMWRPWLTGCCWWGLSWKRSSKLWGRQGPGTTSQSRSACSASLASTVSTKGHHSHTETSVAALPVCSCTHAFTPSKSRICKYFSTAKQVEFMVKEKHIYLMASGRINMCGLTTRNIDYVAESIHEAVTRVQ